MIEPEIRVETVAVRRHQGRLHPLNQRRAGDPAHLLGLRDRRGGTAYTISEGPATEARELIITPPRLALKPPPVPDLFAT